MFSACSDTGSNHVGCTRYWESGSFPIHLYTDESITPIEGLYIKSASQVWNHEVQKEVFVYPGIEKKQIKNGIVLITRKPQMPGIAGVTFRFYEDSISGRLGKLGYSAIELDTELILVPSTYGLTVIHELGHVLGLDHELESTSIMFPKIIETQQIKENHRVIVRKMIDGTYKNKSLVGLPSCF